MKNFKMKPETISYYSCGDCGYKNDIIKVLVTEYKFGYRYCPECLLNRLKEQLKCLPENNNSNVYCGYCKIVPNQVTLCFGDFFICKNCSLEMIETAIKFLEEK